MKSRVILDFLSFFVAFLPGLFIPSVVDHFRQIGIVARSHVFSVCWSLTTNRNGRKFGSYLLIKNHERQRKKEGGDDDDGMRHRPVGTIFSLIAPRFSPTVDLFLLPPPPLDESIGFPEMKQKRVDDDRFASRAKLLLWLLQEHSSPTLSLSLKKMEDRCFCQFNSGANRSEKTLL